MMGGIVTRNM